MALTTYAELQASIQSWLYNKPSMLTLAPDFIRLNEAYMDPRIEHRLQNTLDDAFTFSGELTDLPADFRGVVTLADDTKVLQRVTLEQMAQDRLVYTSTDDQRYAILGSQIQVWPAPANGDTVRLVYRAALPALSESNTSNWLLERYPNAYLYGSLMQAAPYLDKDERIPTWERLFAQAMNDLTATNRVEAQRAVRVRPGGPTP